MLRPSSNKDDFGDEIEVDYGWTFQRAPVFDVPHGRFCYPPAQVVNEALDTPVSVSVDRMLRCDKVVRSILFEGFIPPEHGSYMLVLAYNRLSLMNIPSCEIDPCVLAYATLEFLCAGTITGRQYGIVACVHL